MDLSKITHQYNQDIETYGNYVYTNPDKLSARIANQRLTDITLSLLKMKNKRIIDIGCGDGTYTYAFYTSAKPKSILGIDITQKAIMTANKKYAHQNTKINFRQGNVYNLSNKFHQQFDIGICREILHHISNPRKALQEVFQITNRILIIEPNGYNPFLKVIEKVSPYHRHHREKSYFGFQIKKWITQSGGEVIKEDFINFVPFFCPDIMAITMKKVEPLIEKIPIINQLFCGAYVVLAKKSVSHRV